MTKIFITLKMCPFFQVDDQFLLMTSVSNFKFGGTLFSKIMPNFSRPHSRPRYVNSQLQQFLWSTLIFFDKIKLILYQKQKFHNPPDPKLHIGFFWKTMYVSKLYVSKVK